MIIEFERIVEIVSEIKKSKEEEGGIKQVYFIACGGSLGAFYSADHFLKTEAEDRQKGFSVHGNVCFL